MPDWGADLMELSHIDIFLYFPFSTSKTENKLTKNISLGEDFFKKERLEENYYLHSIGSGCLFHMTEKELVKYDISYR